MPPVGFEPAISAGERPQTYASDRAATGTGYILRTLSKKRAVFLNVTFKQKCEIWSKRERQIYAHEEEIIFVNTKP